MERCAPAGGSPGLASVNRTRFPGNSDEMPERAMSSELTNTGVDPSSG